MCICGVEKAAAATNMGGKSGVDVIVPTAMAGV